MGFYLPSEVSRLVLSYLLDHDLQDTSVQFMEECPFLQELRQVPQEELSEYTRVNGRSLMEILREYKGLIKTISGEYKQINPDNNFDPPQRMLDLILEHRKASCQAHKSVEKPVLPRRPKPPPTPGFQSPQPGGGSRVSPISPRLPQVPITTGMPQNELYFGFLDESLTSSGQDCQNAEQTTLVPQIVSGSDTSTQKLSSNEDSGTGEKTKRIVVKNEDTKEITGEQESLIKKLSYVLNLLQRGKITNDEFFIQVSKPLGDLLSCLKYLPGQTYFYYNLPAEIKRNILSYLCDSGTIVAATVCSEWRDILNDRLISLKYVRIGKHFSNVYLCEEDKCFMPEQMFMAVNILKLNTPLKICSSVTNVIPRVLVDGLTSVSRFCINNTCDCRDNVNEQILTENQMELLIETLEQKSETVDRVGLYSVNMAHLDQDRLTNFLLKIKILHLSVFEGQMNVGNLIKKLLESSIESKLKYLGLIYLEYPDNLSVPLADALCQVPSVRLGKPFRLNLMSTQRLIENILTRPSRIKRLEVWRETDWRTLVSPENMKIFLSKLRKILLCGRFTSDQMEAVKSVPGVNVDDGKGIISKGVN